MTEHDLIRIARDNGIDWFRMPKSDQILFEKFAKAIAAAEREAILKLADSFDLIDATAVRARGNHEAI